MIDVKRAIDKIKDEQEPVYEPIERTTLNVKEIAVYLDLSNDYIYKLCREKKIPHIKIGSRTMFKKSTIDGWLSELERESMQ